jgi:hypothetical protein
MSPADVTTAGGDRPAFATRKSTKRSPVSSGSRFALTVARGARLVNGQWVEGTEEDKKDARWLRRLGKDPLDTPGVSQIKGTDLFLIERIGEE